MENLEGFRVVNFYEDGFVGSKAEGSSLFDLRRMIEVVQSPHLSKGQKAFLAFSALSFLTGCVPAFAGALPVTIVPDSATGSAPDAPHISPTPSLDIMPSLSPSPSIAPSLTPSIAPTMISPTETLPRSTPSDVIPQAPTSTTASTEKPTTMPTKANAEKPTKIVSPTAPPTATPEDYGYTCNLEIGSNTLKEKDKQGEPHLVTALKFNDFLPIPDICVGNFPTITEFYKTTLGPNFIMNGITDQQERDAILAQCIEMSQSINNDPPTLEISGVTFERTEESGKWVPSVVFPSEEDSLWLMFDQNIGEHGGCGWKVLH